MPFARESRDQERATRQKLDLVRQLADDNRGRNELMERINRVVYMQDQVKIPARWQNFALEVKAPLALRTVNTITAALSVNAPAVHFEPIKLGSAGDQNATLREHFFEASWLRQEEEADRQLFRVWMHNLVTHGMGILKTVECANTQWAQYYTESRKLSQAMTSYGPADRHRFDVATEELKLKASYPIMTTVVPPSNFYALQTERGFSVCAEVSDVPYYEALTAYGAGLNRAGKIVPEAQGLPLDEWPRVMSSRRTLRKLEVWEWDKTFHFIADPGSGGGSNNFNTMRLVRVVKHRYGNPLTHTLRGPYFMAGGVSTSSTDNRYSNLSTIFGFLYLYPLYDAMLTGMAEGGFQWAYPFLGQDANAAPRLPELPQVGLSPLVDQHGTQLRSTIQLQPGDVLPPGYHFVEPPRLGMDMKEFMATTRNLLEMALPDVMQGIGTSGDSGYAINLAAQRARAEWDPIVKQAQRALSRRTAFESWLIEVCVGERVYAWGDLPSDGPLAKSREGYLSIHPDDLAGVHRYSVRLEPETPANRVIDVRTHAEMVDKRFETWEQAVEELGNSPSEVELGWLLYDLKQDPDIKQLVLNKAKELVAVSLQSQQAQARADILDALGLGGGGQLAEGQGAGAQAMADAAQAGGPPSGSPAGAQPPGTGLGRYGQVRTPGMGMPIQPPPETIPAHGLPGGGGP